MRPAKQDAIAFDALSWAFSGQQRMTQSQRDQVSTVCRESRLENRESGGKKRSRFWNLGPVWAKRFA